MQDPDDKTIPLPRPEPDQVPQPDKRIPIGPTDI